MPTLSRENRKTTKLTLPSSKKNDPAWVEVYKTMLTEDIVELAKFQGNEAKGTLTSLINIIKAWNFTDASGKIVEINRESVGLLEVEDMMYIAENSKALKKLAKFNTAKKKN